MNFDEIKQVINSDELKSHLDSLKNALIESVKGNPDGIIQLFNSGAKLPFAVRDALFLNRLQNFISGVYQTEEDSIRLSNKLFNDENKKYSNASRVLEIIAKTDSEQKLDFVIAATRCLLCDCIDNTLYFRITKAIVDTLYEDLVYLSDHVLEQTIHVGNQYTRGLEKNGLMVVEVIDGNIDSEYYCVSFTTLGMQVVEYAIDVENVEKANQLKELIEQKKFSRFGKRIAP